MKYQRYAADKTTVSAAVQYKFSQNRRNYPVFNIYGILHTIKILVSARVVSKAHKIKLNDQCKNFLSSVYI